MAGVARTVGLVTSALVLGGVCFFSLCVQALGQGRDLSALYCLAVGGLLLKAAGDILGSGEHQ